MIEVAIPGRSTLRLTTAVLDFNGTLACDGLLCEGVAERLEALGARLALHVVTGDTTGTARQVLSALPVLVHVMPPDRQGAAKRAFLGGLDPGRNGDRWKWQQRLRDRRIRSTIDCRDRLRRMRDRNVDACRHRLRAHR